MQFYLLSFVFNLTACFFLGAAFLAEKIPGYDEMAERIHSSILMISVGIGAAVVGVFKLFSPITPVFFFGDLFPALFGLVAGFILIVSYMKEKGKATGESVDRVFSLLESFQTILAFVGIGVVLLHFLFPEILFI